VADGILSGPIDAEPRRRGVYPAVAVKPGLVVRHRSGVTGAVIDWRPSRVILLDRGGKRHQLLNEPGAFLINGQRVTLEAPERPPSVRRLTSSGSVAVEERTAHTARGSRIWVEGLHDAELVEHVWGDDLRVEGIVVEPLHGVDNLADLVAEFAPNRSRRLGVLVDHLVAGSKEQRIVATIRDPDVLVTGHPFVDIWAAINPSLVGLRAWPDVPRTLPWKEGVCQALGVDDPRRFWRQLLSKVHNYADLHPTLVGSVEQLVDFLTEPTED
jgi:hypothetical protein